MERIEELVGLLSACKSLAELTSMERKGRDACGAFVAVCRVKVEALHVLGEDGIKNSFGRRGTRLEPPLRGPATSGHLRVLLVGIRIHIQEAFVVGVQEPRRFISSRDTTLLYPRRKFVDHPEPGFLAHVPQGREFLF